MRINDKEIEEYGAKQWNVDISYTSISNASEWIPENLIPVMIRSTIGLKKINVSIMIYGNSKEEILIRGQKIIYDLIKPANVKLDGNSHTFRAVLANAPKTLNELMKSDKVMFELYGYEYGNQVVTQKFMVPGDGFVKKTVENKGTFDAPLNITMWTMDFEGNGPIIGSGKPIARLMIQSGSPRFSYESKSDIAYAQLDNNRSLININGESGVVKITEKDEDGKETSRNGYDSTTMWNLPCLNPGNQVLYFTNLMKNDCMCSFFYKEMFL